MQFAGSFEKVEKRIGAKRILNSLSFNLLPLSYTALIGNNGCGKSTTINVLCNLTNYDLGKVRVFDEDLSPNITSYKGRLGIVLSRPSFIPGFSCIEYLSFVAKFHNVPRNESDERMNQLITFLNIENINIPIDKLSQGNQMKVSVASALIHNPEFLILDEPFVNLDNATIDNLMALFKSFYGKKTLLITSHNLDLVADLCDSFLIMKSGTIVSDFIKSEFNGHSEIADKLREMLRSKSDLSDLNWLT